MKNRGKRLLAMLLCVVMCVSLLPVPSLAEEGSIAAAEEEGAIAITPEEDIAETAEGPEDGTDTEEPVEEEGQIEAASEEPAEEEVPIEEETEEADPSNEYYYLEVSPASIDDYAYFCIDYDQYVCVPYGESVTVGVVVSSDYGTYECQWYQDSRENPIDGETETSYTVDSIVEDHRYFCIVTDGAGNHESATAHVFVENTDADLSLNRAAKAVIANDGDTVDFQFTPTETAVYKFFGISSTYTFAELYDSAMNYLTYDTYSGSNGDFKIQYELNAGETYTLRTGFNSSDNKSFFLVFVTERVFHAYANDTTSNYAAIKAMPGSTLQLHVNAWKTNDTGIRIFYDWYGGDGNRIEGAADADYTVDDVEENAQYYCQARIRLL